MTKTSCSVCKSSEHQTCVVRLYYATDWTCRATSSVVVVAGESFCCVRQTNETERESKKVFRKVAPAWRCPYKRKAFLNADSPFLCNDPPKRDIAVTHSWVPVQVAQTSSTSPQIAKANTGTVVPKQSWPPLTFDPLFSPSCRVDLLPCLPSCRAMDPKAAGAGAGSAQKMKLSKLVGGKECKKGGWKGQKKMAHPWSGSPLQLRWRA